MTFTKREYLEISTMSPEQLADKVRNMSLHGIKEEYTALRDEFSRRLSVPSDGLAIVRLDRMTPSHPTAYLWSKWSEASIQKMQAHPTRKWNASCTANTFQIEGENDPVFATFLSETFAKTVIIGRDRLTILDGKPMPEWQNPPLYELMAKPIAVNLSYVMDDFRNLRPNDTPNYIAIHSPYDADSHALFTSGLSTDDHDALDELELETRHKLLVFRISVTDGKPRYFLFDVAEDEGIRVTFAGSKQTDRILNELKDTQRRLGHPLIEEDSGYFRLPRSITEAKMKFGI